MEDEVVYFLQIKIKEATFASTPQSWWTRSAWHYSRDSAEEEARTHTIRDLDLELIEDLLNGLHVGLQVFGFHRELGQSSRENRVQV